MIHRAFYPALIAALATAVIVLAPAPLTGQEAADQAWVEGNHDRALELYTERLTEHPDDRQALHRAALIHGWASRHDESIALFDRLLALDPGNRSAALARARVLAWSGRHSDAASAVTPWIERDPTDVEARVARATFLGWGGDHEGARRDFEAVLRIHPDHLEARRGLARIAGWSGDLARGERLWRALLEEHPDDTAARVGLAQVLRWQGRPHEAHAVLEPALAASPGDEEIAEQLVWVRAAIDPAIAPSVVTESDSDGNLMTTARASVRAYLSPALSLTAGGYLRAAQQRPLHGVDRRAHEAVGANVAVSWALRRGLTGALGAGVHATPGIEGAAIGAASGSLTAASPIGSVGIGFSRDGLLETALLMERRVVIEEIHASARIRVHPRLTLAGGLGHGAFVTDTRNARTRGNLEARLQLVPGWSLLGTGRAFTFAEERREGYFSPDFYGLVELGPELSLERDRWSVSAAALPGLQQVGSGGEVKGAYRVETAVAHRVRPGRSVRLFGTLASNGLETFATGADYRYLAIGIGSSWTF